MKPCPSCGAEAADADTYCPPCGHRLDAVASTRPPRAPAGGCPACGAVDADAGDGFCRACGQSLEPEEAATIRPPPQLSPGDRACGYQILEVTGDSTYLGWGPSGERVLLAFGDGANLDREAIALGALAGDGRFARVVERSTDATRGDVLVLVAPPATSRRLAAAPESLSVASAVETLAAALRAAGAVETQGFAFSPSGHDVYLAPDGSITWSRLRGARSLLDETADARAFLASLGDTLLPEPAARGGPPLVRLLVTARATLKSPNRTVADLLRELSLAEEDIRRAATEREDVAAMCDQGLWRPYNQDAIAIARGGEGPRAWSVMVVCDGVSSSSTSGAAATESARVTRDTLAHFAKVGDAAFEASGNAVATAIRAAHLAVCSEHLGKGVEDLPGTTIVAGLVYDKRLTVGWIGDSRAWWITRTGALQLTRDHSWATEVVARGEMTEEEAMLAPEAHTITRCLGPLEVGDTIAEADPDVRLLDLREPGVIVLATDGLWNYAPRASDIADLVRAAGEGASASEIARLLVACALARGGQDNVSVAVHVHRG